MRGPKGPARRPRWTVTPSDVRGPPGVWRVDPEAIWKPFTGRPDLLSPFDRPVHDRARALELFDFERTLEMYKAAAKRRWGHVALPVLHHEIGELVSWLGRRAR
ncbi:MAG: winged helix DNA-binding domain-containing protein [Actinomycetales bacterium]|nr:winged helix DNA-binding domain-containing protein [Actinomycetales bacterium]